jgi:hypothetical protein
MLVSHHKLSFRWPSTLWIPRAPNEIKTEATSPTKQDDDISMQEFFISPNKFSVDFALSKLFEDRSKRYPAEMNYSYTAPEVQFFSCDGLSSSAHD